ncbi:PIF1, variant [Neurospora crassa OR74A]|nr:PIF1, variant [Neurospora crassa OR74A]ESA43436.1 PIF1, variant [Neurospora crassa OR74A]|eukprot:XP_011393933.1 PIF1, variant [Neurospora crassa OR74A]
MRQRIWRLAGAFPIAHLNQSSRLFSSSCTSLLFATQPEKRHSLPPKSERKSRVRRRENCKRRSLSKEAITVAREYARLKALVQDLHDPPSYLDFHQTWIHIHQAAYYHVLNFRNASGTAIATTHGSQSKSEAESRVGRREDCNGRPLSEEAIVIAREYWEIDTSSPAPPGHTPYDEGHLYQAAYNHVLNLTRAPGTPIARTHQPPIIDSPISNADPPKKNRTASYRHSHDRKPRVDPKSENHAFWQQYYAPKEKPLKSKQKQSSSGVEELPPLNLEQEQIVQLAERGDNIFYTGSAGSGKSRVLKAIVERLRDMGKIVQVVAPTGKAAFNVHGITTWSYVGWSPGLTRQSIEDLVFKSKYSAAAKSRIQYTDVLIIDEISMVENHHFERLNTVHKSIRNDDSPFGGVQVIVVGDFCQLPPVLPFELCYYCGSKMDKNDSRTERGRTYTCVPCNATFTDEDKWAFRSKSWKECNFRTMHLTQIHRQSDPKFVDILQKCRIGVHLTNQDIDLLVNHASNTGNATKLFPTRSEARSVNNREFSKLKGKPRVFNCIDEFHWNRELHPELEYLGENNPDGTLKALQEQVLEPKVELEVGMPVVLFQNLDVAKGLVNGSQGVVIGFERVSFIGFKTNPEVTSDPEFSSALALAFIRGIQDEECPVVDFPNGVTKRIDPIIRIVEYGREPPHTLLARVQLPLGPAWAMTIHRSQGLTMDGVVVDLSKAFAMGQTYVALSRAKSLKGLKVEGSPERLRTGMGLDQAVKDFMDETFGDVWTRAGSVSGTSSVPPQMQQAVGRKRASSG